MPKVYPRREDAPDALDLPPESEGGVFLSLHSWDVPRTPGTVFVLTPRDIVIIMDGWHDRQTIRCHACTDGAVIARKANLPHYGPKKF